MRQGHQNKQHNRQRGRGRRQSGGGGGNPSNRVYDSNGPDVRVRGSAQTVADKYLQLAGDANSAGDRIKMESYYQHAEHYLRIVAANDAVKAQRQAEKDKSALEHAARMEAKRAAQASREAEKAPESEVEEAPVEAKAEEGDDNWQGHQPAFLKTEDEPAEKPKKPRRKPRAKNGSGKPNGKAAKDADAEIASSGEAENGEQEASA